MAADAATGVSSQTRDYIFELIGKQNFSQIQTQTAYDYTDYFFYTSSWKVGNRFPYGNDGRNVGSISDGSYTYTVNGKGCWAYTKFAQQAYYQGAATSRRKYSNSAGVTAKGIKNLLKKEGQAGEHLRVDNTHSLLYLACDDNGFYALSYESGIIKLRNYTWSDFARKYRGKRVWLYNVDTAVNGESESSAQDTPSSVPAVSDQTGIEISRLDVPSTLKTGKSWTCSGIITSDTPLTKVTGYIKDVEGKRFILIPCIQIPLTIRWQTVSLTGICILTSCAQVSIIMGLLQITVTVLPTELVMRLMSDRFPNRLFQGHGHRIPCALDNHGPAAVK